MTFETERLILRNWTVEDAEDHFAIYGDPEVMRFLGVNPVPMKSVEESRARLEERASWFEELEEQNLGYWAVQSKVTGRVVGTVLLLKLPPERVDYEIGWHFGQAHWGKGYATEAALVILRYALEVAKLPEVNAVVYPANERSIRVTQRLGMEPQGLTSQYYEVELELFKIRNPAVTAMNDNLP